MYKKLIDLLLITSPLGLTLQNLNAQKSFFNHFYEPESEIYFYAYVPKLNTGEILQNLELDQKNSLSPVLEYAKNLQLYYSNKIAHAVMDFKTTNNLRERFEKSGEWIFLDVAEGLLSLRYLPMQMWFNDYIAFFHSKDAIMLSRRSYEDSANFLSGNSVDFINDSDFFFESNIQTSYLDNILATPIGLVPSFFIASKYYNPFFYKTDIHIKTASSNEAKALLAKLKDVQKNGTMNESFRSMTIELDGSAVWLNGLWNNKENAKLIADIFRLMREQFYDYR